jgi:uncharacterized membrane protein YdbT with pleckstrin-like domain
MLGAINNYLRSAVRISIAICLAAWYTMVVELSLKSHWGALLRRWIYAIALLAVGVGLSFLTQYLWQIDWYALFIPIAGIILVSMLYNTLNTFKVRVTHTPDREALVISEGVLSRRVHVYRYQRIQGYRTKPSKLDDALGCVQLTITAYIGANEREEYTLCLSKADMDVLLADLKSHLEHQ